MKRMIHIGLLMTLSATALATSIVTLSGGGTVLPATSLQLSLNGLIPSVTYSVVCYIDTTYPFHYIRFDSNFTNPTSVLISSSLNGYYVSQDQLIPGHNIAVIDGRFTNPSTDKLVYTNLDQTRSFVISNCFAISKKAYV